MSVARVWGAVALMACGAAEAPCGDADCAAVCDARPAPEPPPGQLQLTPFEMGLVQPVLASVREGVKPVDDRSIGVCQGATRSCDSFVGLDAGELPEGEYSIQAHVSVPDVGPQGTWKVTFVSSCDTIRVKDDGTEIRTTSQGKERSFDVVYRGENVPYPLAPLRRIESPAKQGRQECTFVIRFLHPDNPAEYKGSWVVPQGEPTKKR